MPSWNIHLAIAKEINKSLKLEKDIFYLGNLIADVDYSCKLNHNQTHYDNVICKSCPSELLSNQEEFLQDYQNNIKDSPLILGYYCHILTDYYYNNIVFSKCWVQNKNNEIIGIKLKNGKILKEIHNDFTKRKKYKQNDFELYGKYLFNNNYVELPEYNGNIKKELNLLKEKFFTIDKLKERVNYLNKEFKKKSKYNLKEKIFGLKYELFTKEELDKMFKECINLIMDNIKKL